MPDMRVHDEIDSRALCAYTGCGMRAPRGYLSIRGFCAKCEYDQYRKVLTESLHRESLLKQIEALSRAGASRGA